MSGGHRNFTLQDVLGSLNNDLQNSQKSTAAVLIDLLIPANETVTVTESVSATTASPGFVWGTTEWGAGTWT